MLGNAPCILIVTGIMAAGKSTIAQKLAEQIPSSVHLRGDVFRRMIVNNQAKITPDTMDIAIEQLHLRYRLATTAAKQYYEAGFTVIYQDVIIGELLTEVVDMLAYLPLYLVVLCPSPEVVAQREAERDKTGYGAWTPQQLDDGLRLNTPKIGLWLDNSYLSVEESIKSIFEHIPAARLPAK